MVLTKEMLDSYLDSNRLSINTEKYKKRFYMNLVQSKMRIIVGPIRIFMSNFER